MPPGRFCLAPSEIVTPRLRLRKLEAGDLDAFAALNADSRVMEFFPRPWTRAESDAALTSACEAFEARGFGVYAAELSGIFAGVVGLSVPSFEAHFTPCVEILWRLLPDYWGQGYATEAAASVLAMAFETLALNEIVAFATTGNHKSIRVMEKIGMQRDVNGDFDHPLVSQAGLRRYVLYRCDRAAALACQ